MAVLDDLKTVRSLTYVEGECSKCDLETGHVCEMCFINSVAGDAIRAIERNQRLIDELKSMAAQRESGPEPCSYSSAIQQLNAFKERFGL